MLHNSEYFCKYVTAETALLILQNRTLKYSSPAIFNDPFDIQTRVDFDFGISEFMEAFIDELYRLVHAEKEPVGDDNNTLFRDIKAMWHIAQRSSRKMPKEVFKQETRTLVEDTIKLSEQYIEDINYWWKQFVRASRVFCVAEEHENLLMWAHYAEEHTGAVIKFRCLPELDTPLCAAKKVDYVKKPPVIAKLDEYIQYITRHDPDTLNQDSLFYDLILSKTKNWEYEKEWRVFIPPVNMENPTIPKDDNGNEILFDLMSFYPQEIHAIYLGCKMNNDNRQKIVKCLTGDFGHVKKYNCFRSEKEYKLDFEEMIG